MFWKLGAALPPHTGAETAWCLWKPLLHAAEEAVTQQKMCALPPARGPRADSPSHGLPEAPGAHTLRAHTGQGRVGLLEGMRDQFMCQVPVSRSGDSLAGQKGHGWGGRTLKEP